MILSRLNRVRALTPIMPIVERLDRAVVGARRESSVRTVMAQLRSTNSMASNRLFAALTAFRHNIPEPDAIRINRIESERERLSRDQSPLVGDTAAEPGIYDDGLTVANACAVSKPPEAAAFLYLLVRAFNPACVLELGTNLGISSSYVSSALKACGDAGRCTTMDSSTYRLHQARQVHANLALHNVDYVQGLFTDTLQPTLDRLPKVDFAFVDGHHQFQPTLDYFEIIAQHASPGAVFVFDDIRWSDGMRSAWDVLRRHDGFGLVADLTSVGVCVLRTEDDHARLATRRLQVW